ncbi:MAG: RsmB/NOP family class I SAM-dependent RNA methyltransferase [Promethearchaeota archaeon]
MNPHLRENTQVFHYYKEIVRFWSKLNFIVKKVIKNYESLHNEVKAKFLYAAYRTFWENASERTIFQELKEIDKKILKKMKNFSWNKALARKDENEKLSILEAIPSFIVDHLLPVMDFDFLKKNIEYMNGYGDTIETTIRINNLNTDLNPESLLSNIKGTFDKNSIHYHMDDDIPDLLWVLVSQKNRIIKNSFYKKRNLLFHDKGSVAIVKILSPNSSNKIIDMCAAPGMKTALIAQEIDNKGKILAGEFLNDRAKMMKNLLSNLNIANTHIINTDSIIFPTRDYYNCDLILLDAPCTGSGSFLSNPELKWRQNYKFLNQNVTLQKKLLENALKLLKPNGILVYATCSLYPEEGEYQILDYIHELDPLDLPKWLSPSYKIKNKTLPGTGRLFPSTHHTQGFFIGKFKKK